MSWNKVKDSMNIQSAYNDFVIRTEYNVKMMRDYRTMSPKKGKRFRSAFTTDQVNYLEMQYKKSPYIHAQRKEVAMALNISERAVKIWFQNRRMKEKKESSNKEFDDEPCNRNLLESPKDQLNNVTTTSTNDPQSFSLLNDANQVNCNKIVTNDSSTGFTIGLLVKDSGFKAYEDGALSNNNTVGNFIETPNSMLPSKYKNSAEFSIDLCKKYKSESASKINFIPSSTIKKEEDEKPFVEQLPTNLKFTEQTVPEDLSYSRKQTASTTSQEGSNIVPTTPGYLSVVPTISSYPLYTQPCYTSSGVFWKPVNILPNVPAVPSVPITVPNNIGISPVMSSLPIAQETTSKKCCSCDCHVNPLVSYNVPQQSTTPQYIITAVQLQNPSVNKF